MTRAHSSLVFGHQLSRWTRRQIRRGENPVTITRTLVHQVSRWFTAEPEDRDEALGRVIRTGSRQWDAFAQALVARRCHEHGLKAPAWSHTAVAVEGWSPHDALVRSDDWYKIMVLNTPADFLERGVVFPRSDLQEI